MRRARSHVSLAQLAPIRKSMHLPLVGLDCPLNRGYCKKPLVKLSVLLSWVPPDVVELHVRQSSLAPLQVDLEVFVANGAQPSSLAI